MPLKQAISDRAKNLGLNEAEVLDVVTSELIGIKFDKVFLKHKRGTLFYVNNIQVEGFAVSIVGKKKDELIVTFTKKYND